jgi:chorismate mutase
VEEIRQLRQRIDEVDTQILRCLSERVQICKSIGFAKKKQGASIRDAAREREVFRAVREKAVTLSLDPTKVESIYRQIVNMCSSVQGVKEKCE